MPLNNVQESTTTTGTGDITLGGASENGRTFTSQLDLNVRFSYFIDDEAGEWESGTGYLSASSTLVREDPQDGSASVPVSFSSGTKQVFIAYSATHNCPSYPNIQATLAPEDKVCSTHIANFGSTVGMGDDDLYYIPFVLERAMTVGAIGAFMTSSTSSTTTLMGIYSVDDNGDPADLLAECSIDTSISAGYISGSVTAIDLPAGKYFVSYWSDTTLSWRSTTWYACNDSGMVSYNYEGRPHGGFINASVLSLTSLPDPATAPAAFRSNSVLTMFLEV